MAIDAISHGHDAGAGVPATGTKASATAPAPSAISAVVASGSSVRLMLAFQPAWQAAANSTARKTNRSISAGPAALSFPRPQGEVGPSDAAPSCPGLPAPLRQLA